MIGASLFISNIRIPHKSIKTIDSHQDIIGRIFNYSTITIALINQPHAVVIPHMTNPEQVIKYLEIRDGSRGEEEENNI